MKPFDWSEEKNQKLKAERGIGFEDVVVAISTGNLLKKFKHPNQKRYPNQMMYVVKLHDYAFAVPYVEDDQKIFLKTIYPSRDFTVKFIEKGNI